MKLNLTKDWYERNIEKEEETMNLDAAIRDSIRISRSDVGYSYEKMQSAACILAGEVERLQTNIERLESEITKLREENKQLRLGWCRESEKRQDEWHSESAKTPVKIAAIGDTLCHHCNGVGQIETRIVYDMKTPYSVHGWAICNACAGKGHL